MIHEQENSDLIILTPGGSLDFEGVHQFQMILKDSLAKNKSIEVDLSQVPGLTSAVIGAMIATHNALSKRKQKLIITHAGAEIIRLFGIMGLDQHFDIKADQE